VAGKMVILHRELLRQYLKRISFPLQGAFSLYQFD
jgi:hypothetical protein